MDAKNYKVIARNEGGTHYMLIPNNGDMKTSCPGVIVNMATGDADHTDNVHKHLKQGYWEEHTSTPVATIVAKVKK